MANDNDATIQATAIRPRPDRIPEKNADTELGSDSFMALIQDSIGLPSRKGVSLDIHPLVEDYPTGDPRVVPVTGSQQRP